MSGESTDRAAELALHFKFGKLRQLPLQSFHEDPEFFADGRGRGRLAVSETQKRNILRLARHGAQIFQEFAEDGTQDVLKRAMNHQAVGQIVDVFARQTEVDEFEMFLQSRNLGRDRKSVVWGKSVDLGGRRIIK